MMALDWQDHEAGLIACRRCPRLVEWREQVARTRRPAYSGWEYWGRPVPGFGDPQARVVAVGLAPGAHGSNRTGRMFTGDASGDFLYAALHRAGFASQPSGSRRDDGLALSDMYITAVCRCAPPDNKPLPAEMLACRPYLLAELEMLTRCQGFVALGRIAFDNLLAIYRDWGYRGPAPAFTHGGLHRLGLDRPWIITSYHPSRQNTQTGRLTPAMFEAVWENVKSTLA